MKRTGWKVATVAIVVLLGTAPEWGAGNTAEVVSSLRSRPLGCAVGRGAGSGVGYEVGGGVGAFVRQSTPMSLLCAQL